MRDYKVSIRFICAFLTVFTAGLWINSFLSSPLLAQDMKRNVQSAKNTGSKGSEEKAGPETTPYDKELFRLSELLGALGYLHPLCTGNGSDEWPKKMQLLIDAEGRNNMVRKSRITGAYNKGFRNYALIYHKCTPNAHAVIRTYSSEAEKLSKRISSRYGG